MKTIKENEKHPKMEQNPYEFEIKESYSSEKVPSKASQIFLKTKILTLHIYSDASLYTTSGFGNATCMIKRTTNL